MILFLAACVTPAELDFAPSLLDFGEVDFAGEMPDGGYASATVTLTNEGESTVTIGLPAYDFDRLCLEGFPDDADYPVDLGEIAPGASYVFVVGVCAYVSGEIGTEVETLFEVATDGEPASYDVNVVFTPVRSSD